MTRIKNFALTFLAMLVAFAATSAYAQYSVLYNFESKSGDGYSPEGFVAQGDDGGLYSTTEYGGDVGSLDISGTAFKVTPEGHESILHNFCAQKSCTDGAFPYGGLTLRPDGHFLGVTIFNGGFQDGSGTIFDISQTGSLTTLHTFTGGVDGADPSATLILGPDGSFYGTTRFGGGQNCGTIYKITGTVFAIVHSFDDVHGCNPIQPLVLGTDGNFYGTTQAGGTAGTGVVFQLQVPSGKASVLTVLADFSSSNLIEGSDGNFYGTGLAGIGFGSVFKITPTGTVTVLHDLNGTTDGSDPQGLVLATNGNFYGVAAGGGSFSDGTLFQVTPTGSFSVLYTFDGTTGSAPVNLVQHTNGLLYGDTIQGGTASACKSIDGCGVFFSWDGGLPAFVALIHSQGSVGSAVEILGQGFTPSTTVSFNGTIATATVVSGTYLTTSVPTGVTTGYVTVTTSNGTLSSNQQFIVTP